MLNFKGKLAAYNTLNYEFNKVKEELIKELNMNCFESAVEKMEKLKK